MSDVGARLRKQSQNTEHRKSATPEAPKPTTKNDGNRKPSQSSQSSKKPLLRDREADQAHEEDTAGCLCPILAHLPHFHWSKKKERSLAGDQFAYNIWHNPREEVDESPGIRRCPDCKTLCNCLWVWRWWPGWGGN